MPAGKGGLSNPTIRGGKRPREREHHGNFEEIKGRDHAGPAFNREGNAPWGGWRLACDGGI